MRLLSSVDGELAKGPDGGLSVLLPVDAVEPEAVEQFKTQPLNPYQYYALIGRSGLAIAAGYCVYQANRLGMVSDGFLYIPAVQRARSSIGEFYIDCVNDKLDAASDGEKLRWSGGKTSAVGRILGYGALELLYADELTSLAESRSINFWDAYKDGRPTNRILENAIAVPVPPWELQVSPNHDLLETDSFTSFTPRGRNFALNNMVAEMRHLGDQFGKWTVGTVLFGPGSQYGKVVGVQTRTGFLPQEEAAAWLDPHRSKGYSKAIPLERCGRQFEVNREDDNEHFWDGAEVIIQVYKNTRQANVVNNGNHKYHSVELAGVKGRSY